MFLISGNILVMTFLLSSKVTGQYLDSPRIENNGLCGSPDNTHLNNLDELTNCIVLIGNLIINLENTTSDYFANLSYPYLREVTGYLVTYNVQGLNSLGNLFPNLTLIRGQQLIWNYALAIHTMPDLKEIGLHSLITIERGGVLVWYCPAACFVDTVSWATIAPKGPRIIAQTKTLCEGPEACRCMNFPDIDYCWNEKKCQRFLSGPVAEKCHEQCLGCRKTDQNKCARCKNYTDNYICVSKCPDDKIILEPTKHCLTRSECYELYNGKGWILNKTCVEKCPQGSTFQNNTDPSDISNGTCVQCEMCTKIKCGSLRITSLSDAERYSHCINIDGHLNIHLHSSHESMDDLTRFLGGIEQIKDYLILSSSVGITSLAFLQKLKTINGTNLWENGYAIVIFDMKNLVSLFPEKQAQTLKILNGKIRAYYNPQLCMAEIENFHNYINLSMGHSSDIPWSLNGYLGECHNIPIPFNATATGKDSAQASFKRIKPVRNPNVTLKYFLHYVEVSQGYSVNSIPLYCNIRSWKMIEVDLEAHNKEIYIVINLSNLRPSTTYGVYVDAYPNTIGQIEINENLTDYGRSLIENFTTFIGLPPPPFIVQIAAPSPYSFALNWVNHQNYAPHITRYLLDFSIINYDAITLDSKNHCQHTFTLSKRIIDDSLHVSVRTPPSDYGELCVCNDTVNFRQDSNFKFKQWLPNCNFSSLSPIPTGEHFDVCDSPGIDCSGAWENKLLENITISNIVQSMGVELMAPRNYYVAEGLLPYHEYKVRLRACTGPSENDCGRSSRETVRTQINFDNDLVNIRDVSLDEDNILLTWDPPNTPNGPVLAYVVQLLKHRQPLNGEPDHFETCVTQVEHERNGREFHLKLSKKIEKYSIRVCTSSMGINRACGSWISSTISQKVNHSWLVVTIVVVFLTAIAIIMLVLWWRKRQRRDDRTHLLENIELSSLQPDPFAYDGT